MMPSWKCPPQRPPSSGRATGLRSFAALWITLLLSLARIDAASGPQGQTLDGFALPQPGRRFDFPRDHGSHPEFKIEWWYITGHLQDEAGHRFGFQATFFRRASPWATNAPTQPVKPEPFGNRHLHLAHMALADIDAGRFLHEERLNRDGWDAGAAVETLRVHNGNWSLQFAPGSTHIMQLHGTVRSLAVFELDLDPVKPLVFFGEKTVSRKGAAPEASSHYITFPRLRVSGGLTLDGKHLRVRGEAWMDHEISSSQLDDSQAGWDWAGIHLKDGREIMVYRMRRKDGQADPFSTLAWVDKQGAVTHLDHTRFSWTSSGTWKSPVTGAVYPVPVRLTAVDPRTGQPQAMTLEPLLLQQELTGRVGGIAYWEGACRVLDAQGREIGAAYVELTGYAGDLKDRFR